MDLANLIGYHSESSVSRLEQCERDPNLEAALSCQVLFGIPASALFPKLYSAIEERVMQRAAALYEEVEGNSSPDALRKRQFLKAVQDRAVTKPKTLFDQ